MPTEGYASVYAEASHRYEDLAESAIYSFPSGEVRTVPDYVAELLIAAHPTKLRYATADDGPVVAEMSPARVVPGFQRSQAFASPPSNTAMDSPGANATEIVAEDDRCIANKANGDRCKNKKKADGTCAVHTPRA